MLKTFKILSFLLFLLSDFTSYGQNLVPNPSFEDTSSCPNWDTQLYKALPWYQPTMGSSDLFHSCDIYNYVGVPYNFIGYQNARTGNAYAGVYTYYKPITDSSYGEYIAVGLEDSLIAGTKYCISFFVSLGDSAHYATSVELYLSKDSVLRDGYSNINANPQIYSNTSISDRMNWIEVSGDYVADGGEKFITIGNFKSNAMIDTVFVEGGGDPSFNNYKGAFYFIDDVSVVNCDTVTGITEKERLKMNLYPNPSSMGMFYLKPPISMVIKSIQVIDLYGNTILNNKENNIYDQSTITINMQNNLKGIYFLLIQTTETTIIKKIIYY